MVVRVASSATYYGRETRMSSQPGKRVFRVAQNEGAITWRVEELWDGGVVRGPFGAKEYAVRREQNIAKEQGFFDALVLEDASGQASEKPVISCFEKAPGGEWRCIDPVSLNVGKATIIVGKGTTFKRGVPFMGMDVAKWLDELPRS